MKRRDVFWVLFVVVAGIGACMYFQDAAIESQIARLQETVRTLQQQQPLNGAETTASAPSSTSADDAYYEIPELKIKFTKVPGLTLDYHMKDSNTVTFTSEEITAAAKTDPAVADCASSDWFPTLEITTIPKSGTEYQGYGQTELADGRYLNTYGPQAVCYSDNATQADKDLAMNQLNMLFHTFLGSVQSY